MAAAATRARAAGTTRESRTVDIGEAIARAVDDVDVVACDARFPQPVRERQIRLESGCRERPQQREGVATADEYVEVLRASDALCIVPQRIAAADQERN